ncbi:MAG: hypothetical protein LC808_30525, partial [Actinobacteria bacterium]|nr:hypothetical protein [Actinomycetota bacterium]
CKMIIDIVTFIVERGAQIVQFVNAVLDAVIAIAGGGAGGVPTLIENALALSIPVLIGALAAILGVSGIAEKVKKFFQSLSKPVMKAVDWVVGKIVAFGKKIWAKLKSKFGSKKDKSDDKDPRSADQKMQAVKDAAAEVESTAGAAPEREKIQQHLPAIKSKYKLTRLYFKDSPGGKYQVIAEINPRWPTKQYPPGETKYTITVDGERVLRPTYAKGQPIRRYLYSSNNRSATKRIIEKWVTPLIREKDKDTGEWRQASDFSTAKFWEPTPGQIVSMTDHRTKPTVEHDPPVVAHWNAGGNNSNQQERIKYYHFRENEDAAKVLMFFLNRELGGGDEEGYTTKVGPDFKEPGEK